MNPLLKLIAVEHGGVFSRAQALSCGYTHEQLEVVRIVWADLKWPADVATRVRRAFARRAA
jgi:hypothetical protein